MFLFFLSFKKILFVFVFVFLCSVLVYIMLYRKVEII